MLAGLALALSLLVDAPAAVAAEPVEVIANTVTPVRDLSRATLRAIFSMRLRQWPDGTAITVFVLPDRNETHRAFCTQLLRVYPYVLRDTWDRQVFTGTGQAPIQVASQQELERMVGLVRGSIGYAVKNGSTPHEIERIKNIEIR